jgi:hypothetical protein
MFEEINKRFFIGAVIPAKAGIQLKCPGFRLKARMTTAPFFSQNA